MKYVLCIVFYAFKFASSIKPKHHPELNARPMPTIDIQGKTKNQYHQNIAETETYTVLATNNCAPAFIGILSATASQKLHRNPRGYNVKPNNRTLVV
jgi:hypothetical protein